MRPRILAVVPGGSEVEAAPAMAALVRIARAERAAVRLACFHRIPRPRLDRHGRMVRDVDQEMARIEAGSLESMRLALGAVDGMAIETVVRFGAPTHEIGLEVDAFAPGLVALLGAGRSGFVSSWRLWSIQRRIGRRSAVRLLMLETPGLRGTVIRRGPLSPWWSGAGMAENRR